MEQHKLVTIDLTEFADKSSQLELLKKTQKSMNQYLAAWIIKNGSIDYGLVIDRFGDKCFMSLEPAYDVDPNTNSRIDEFIQFMSQGCLASCLRDMVRWERQVYPKANPNDFCLYLNFDAGLHGFLRKKHIFKTNGKSHSNK